ncbi:unnamed protein product [Closterium sp. NIES-53]
MTPNLDNPVPHAQQFLPSLEKRPVTRPITSRPLARPVPLAPLRTRCPHTPLARAAHTHHAHYYACATVPTQLHANQQLPHALHARTSAECCNYCARAQSLSVHISGSTHSCRCTRCCSCPHSSSGPRSTGRLLMKQQQPYTLGVARTAAAAACTAARAPGAKSAAAAAARAFAAYCCPCSLTDHPDHSRPHSTALNRTFDCTADLITHMRSLDAIYRATCTEAELALLPPSPPPWRSLFTSSSLASLTAFHLSMTRFFESNLVCSLSMDALSCIFTFTASLASTASPASDETAAMSTTCGRPRAGEVREGGRVVALVLVAGVAEVLGSLVCLVDMALEVVLGLRARQEQCSCMVHGTTATTVPAAVDTSGTFAVARAAAAAGSVA